MTQITIEELLPLLKRGWVAADGRYRKDMWFWYRTKPVYNYNTDKWMLKKVQDEFVCLSYCFNIKSAEDGEHSLRRIK